MSAKIPPAQWILFVFLAVPGFFVALASLIILLAAINLREWMNVIASLLTFGLSSVIVLIGVGKFREPAYLLVIWSFPIGVVLMELIFRPGGKGFLVVLGGGLCALATNVYVRAYYRKRNVVKVRKARVADCEEICRVHKASISALCSSSYTPRQIDAWAGPRKPEDYEVAIQSDAVFIALDGRRIIGFAQLEPKEGEIRALYIGPEHIRRGVGSQLLETLESEARSAGLRNLRLNATLNSVSFYEARGFVNRGEGTNRLPSGVDLPCVHMEKNL